MDAAPRKRLVLLLAPLTTPDGVVPAGERLLVDEAEARVLRGAIGLVEDLGEAPIDAPAKTDTGGEGDAKGASSGSVPQPLADGHIEPAADATAAAGDDTLPGAAPGDGNAATDAAPVSDAPKGKKAKG